MKKTTYKDTTSYNIKIDKKLRIERMAMELGLKIGRNVKWTEVMNVLVDNFAKDAISHIEYMEQQEKKGNA